MNAVRIEVSGRSLLARPLAYLAGERFASYVAACRRVGLSYSALHRCQTGTNDRHVAISAVKELRAEGFEVSVDPTVGEMLEGIREAAEQEAARARTLHDAAVARMQEIDARLAERGLALYPYQRDGVRWLSHRTGAGLFDEMGLGKTIQALIAARSDAPFIVSAPAAVKGVWYREARKWRPDLGWPKILKGRRSFRWPLKGQAIITNYDILPKLDVEPFPKKGGGHRFDPEKARVDGLGEPRPGTVLIFDEAHLLKGHRTIRHRRAATIARQVRRAGGQVWCLTGTPVLNRQDELWNVLDAAGIANEVFGSKKEFYRLTNAYATQYGVRFGGTRPEVPVLLQKCTLMRRREEVLADLPTKIHRELSVDCIDEAVAALADRFAELAKKAGIDIATATLEDILALLKQPLVFELMAKMRAALAKAKTAAALELVDSFEDAGEALVVFSAHRAPVAAFAARPGWAEITGDTPASERTRLEERFQAGELKGLAGTIKAMGVGLTLTKAHQAIFVDREWTPGLNTQAEDRICRIGQDRGCIITTLCAAHPVDERLAELLTEKTEVIEDTVNASARTEVEEQLTATLSAVEVKVEAVAPVSAQGGKNGAPPATLAVPFLQELLERARLNGLAQPTIRLDGLQLQWTGRMSKYPDSIHVTQGGGRAGEWWGWIDRDGVWHQRRNPPPEVVSRIERYNADTASLVRDAQSWAKECGRCSFCGLELTDARSVTVGYGPQCAERYGLPWGAPEAIGTTKVEGWLERGW